MEKKIGEKRKSKEWHKITKKSTLVAIPSLFGGMGEKKNIYKTEVREQSLAPKNKKKGTENR